MCDPVTIGIALASAAGSSILQGKAASAVAKKRNNVMQTTENDLRGYRDNAAQSFRTSLDKAGTDQLQADDAQNVEKRTQDYTKNISQDDLLPSQQNASSAAKQVIMEALEKGAARSRDTATRRAAVDAYGDTTLGRDIVMNRQSQNIGQQGSFAAGRAGVGELELADAAHAGDKWAKLAGIVSALGTVAGGVYSAGAGSGMWGGLDPKTGITWNTGRQLAKPVAFGPVNPSAMGPFPYGSPNTPLY